MQRLHRKRDAATADNDSLESTVLELVNVNAEVLENAGVSKRELAKLKIVLNVDKSIFVRDEKKIHMLLDTLNINQVNIKETEEGRKSCIDSPNLRKAFDEQSRNSLFGTNRGGKKSPSMFQRRMRLI